MIDYDTLNTRQYAPFQRQRERVEPYWCVCNRLSTKEIDVKRLTLAEASESVINMRIVDCSY
jgi:hypothetical protein